MLKRTVHRTMISSSILNVYNDQRTAFTLNDIAMLVGECDFNSLT